MCARLRLRPDLLAQAMRVRPRLVRTWAAEAMCTGVRQVRGGLMICGLTIWGRGRRRTA
jgi:hypothetical protein